MSLFTFLLVYCLVGVCNLLAMYGEKETLSSLQFMIGFVIWPLSLLTALLARVHQ